MDKFYGMLEHYDVLLHTFCCLQVCHMTLNADRFEMVRRSTRMYNVRIDRRIHMKSLVNIEHANHNFHFEV